MNAQNNERDAVYTTGLNALIAKLVAKRWWIAGCAAGFAAAFTVAALMMTPKYRATIVLIAAVDDRGSEVLGSGLGQLGGLASIIGINVGSDRSETEEALAVLRSRQFTEQFINELNLMPKLFAAKWDAADGKWKVPPERQPTPAKAFKYFDENVRSVVQDKKTGLVTLHIVWRDRNEAATWANELAQRLNREMRARAIAKAEASVGFLEKELQATSTIATRDAISRLMEAQVKQRMLASVTQEYAFRIVDKAMAPDADDPTGPRKLALIVAGPFVGLFVAIICIVVWSAVRWELKPPVGQ